MSLDPMEELIHLIGGDGNSTPPRGHPCHTETSESPKEDCILSVTLRDHRRFASILDFVANDFSDDHGEFSAEMASCKFGA